MSKVEPRLLPIGWEHYWKLRMYCHMRGASLDYLQIPEAKQEMIKQGYEGFRGMHPHTLRQLELYTIANMQCDCEWCLMGYGEKEGLDHRVPVKIVSAEYHNWCVLDEMKDAL